MIIILLKCAWYERWYFDDSEEIIEIEFIEPMKINSVHSLTLECHELFSEF